MITFPRIALPCSRTPLPTSEALVGRADAIVLAKAQPRALHDTVTFQIVETLKGIVPTPLIAVAGELTADDDVNDSPFPYQFVRRGGRHGNCFAKTYRAGREYLLMLRPTDPTTAVRLPFAPRVTPYWEALAPTNEQVTGTTDRWVVWVRAQVAKSLPR